MGDKSEIVAYLTCTREEMIELVRSVSPERVDQPQKEGEWSLREALAHLTVLEPTLCVTARKVIAGEDPTPPPGHDSKRSNIEQVQARRGQTVDQLLAQMSANRTETLRFIDELTDADLAKSVQFPRLGEVTAEFFLRHIGRHELAHAMEAIR